MKIDVHIHPAGIASLVLMVLFMPIEAVLAGMAAVLLHEGGHLLAMKCCGVRHCFVEWTPLGFLAQVNLFSALQPLRQAIIASAGPVTSGIGMLICLLARPTSGWGYSLFIANLSLLVLNSLPLLPLDGARLLLAVASVFGMERSLQKALLYISYGTSLLLAALGIWGAANGVLNPLLLAIGPYLAYAAKRSTHDLQMENVRLLHQRKTLRRKKIVPASVYVSDGVPDAMELLRLLRDEPLRRYALLQIVHSHEKTEQWTEEQMIDRLFEHL